MSTLKVDNISPHVSWDTNGRPYTAPGMVLQVVNGHTETAVTCSTDTYTDIVSANITPSSVSSKLFVSASCNMHVARDGDQLLGHWLVQRDGTTLNTPNEGGDAGMHVRYVEHPAAAAIRGSLTYNKLDEPATTSQVTYKIQVRDQNDGDGGSFTKVNGVDITVMEIAG